MPLSLSRRGFLIGALFAPAVVRATNLMPVRDPGLVQGIWLGGIGNSTPAFEMLDNPFVESFIRPIVWLHKSHWAVKETIAARSVFNHLADQPTTIQFQEPAEIRAITDRIAERQRSRMTAERAQAIRQRKLVDPVEARRDLAETVASITHNERVHRKLIEAAGRHNELPGKAILAGPGSNLEKCCALTDLEIAFQSTLEVVLT